MLKKISLVLVASIALLAAAGYALYATNSAPAVSAGAAVPGNPYVVKLHAQWCPICMLTKGVWSEIDAEYSSRANLVVFDFTNEATTQASRVEAARLGLERFFDEHSGWTGTIAVLDARTKDVAATVHGIHDIADYRAAIDASLARLPSD